VIVALPLAALVVDLPRPRPRLHVCILVDCRGWGGCRFDRGRGGYRCGRVCEPSCLRVCRRWAHSLGPLIASAWWSSIPWRWSELGGFIDPPRPRLAPRPPRLARHPCQLAPPPTSRARVACPPPARLARLLLLLALAWPVLLSLVSPLLLLLLLVISPSASFSRCLPPPDRLVSSSSRPCSLSPHPSSVSPLLVVVVSPSGFACRQCRRFGPCRCLGLPRLPPSPDPTSIETSLPTSLWKGEGRLHLRLRF
jgi:hypothetical protein